MFLLQIEGTELGWSHQRISVLSRTIESGEREDSKIVTIRWGCGGGVTGRVMGEGER